MVELEPDFIPDFVYKGKYGEISNKHSKIIQRDKKSYISVGTSLKCWETRSSELKETICKSKHKISTFNIVNDFIIIGYENGVVEIKHEFDKDFEDYRYKAHTRRISQVFKVDDFILSSSNDGTLVLYDLNLEMVKINYNGNSSCIDFCIVHEDKVIAGCSDNSIKIWNIFEETLKNIYFFEKRVKCLYPMNNFLVIFFFDGESVFFDLETKKIKEFRKFKKMRMTKTVENFLYVLTNKKLYKFKNTSPEGITLTELASLKTESKYVDFEIYKSSHIFITQDNGFEIIDDSYFYSYSYHKNEITNLDKDINGNICTFSSDKLIIWDIDENLLARLSSIELSNAECYTSFMNFYVVGNKKGLIFYSINNKDKFKEFELNKVVSLSTSNNVLAVGYEKSIALINSDLEIFDNFECEDYIAYIKLINSPELLFVSALNSKVYVYELPTFDQKLVLYGHSLPVKHINVSPDCKNIITTGADKVIKIWGFDFGDCRKTIVNDTKCVEFINNDLFILGSGSIKYYKTHSLLKEYKNCESCYIKLIDDKLFSINNTTIDVFTMDIYELDIHNLGNGDSSSEEDYNEVLQKSKILRVKKYDEFLSILENLECKDDEITLNSLYTFLENISLGDLDNYFNLLSVVNLNTLVSSIAKLLERQPLLFSRIFTSLVRGHRDIVIHHKDFKFILEHLQSKIADLRKLSLCNSTALLINKETEGSIDLNK